MDQLKLSQQKAVHVIPSTVINKDAIQRTDTHPLNQSLQSNTAQPDFGTNPVTDESYRESGTAILVNELDKEASSNNAATSRMMFPSQNVAQMPLYTKRTGQNTSEMSRDKALFENKFDMLDQYSKIGSSNRMPTHINSSQMSQPSEDGKPSRRIASKSSTKIALNKLKQKQGVIRKGASVEALQDLNDVLDVRVHQNFGNVVNRVSQDMLRVENKRTHIQVKNIVGIGAERSTINKVASYRTKAQNFNKLPDVRKQLKSQQKTRRQLLAASQQQKIGSRASNNTTLIGAAALTSSVHSSSFILTQDRAVTQESQKNRQTKRPQTRQSKPRYVAEDQKLTPNEMILQQSFRKGVVDLNQQLIQSDQAGLFVRQSKSRSSSSKRQQLNQMMTSQQLAKLQLQNQIKVEIETKNSQRLEKLRKKQKSGNGPRKIKALEKSIYDNTLPTKNEEPMQKHHSDRQNSGVATLSQPSVIHSATVKERDVKLKQPSFLSNKGWDAENENQSSSSFNTLGMPTSYLRTAKHLSQIRDSDIQSNLSPLKTIKQQDSDNITVVIPGKQLVPDFVVKSFQNTIKTKAQRDAKKMGQQNPYFSQKSIKRDAVSIAVNSFEDSITGGVQQKRTSLNQSQASMDMLNANSITSDVNQMSRVVDLISPVRINPHQSIGKESDMKYSTQKKVQSSLNSDQLDVNVDMFNNQVSNQVSVAQDSSIMKNEFDLTEQKQAHEITVMESQIRFEVPDDKSTTRLENTLYNNKDNASSEQTLATLPQNIASKGINLRMVNIQGESMISQKQLIASKPVKLEESVAKERQAILKRKQMVQQNLVQTKSLVERPSQNLSSQNVFNVQNIRLFPRQDKHDKGSQPALTVPQSANAKDYVFRTNTRKDRAQSSHQVNAMRELQSRRSRKTMSICYLKRYQQQHRARQVGQPPQTQFDISIRPANSTLLQNQGQRKQKSQIIQNPYACNNRSHSLIKGDTLTDLHSEEENPKELTTMEPPIADNRLVLKALQEPEHLVSTKDRVSIRSSSVLTMSRGDDIQLIQGNSETPMVDLSQEYIKIPQKEFYADKGFKVRRSSIKKSMVAASSAQLAKQQLGRTSFIVGDDHDHTSQCNCQSSQQSLRQRSSIEQQSKHQTSELYQDLSENQIDFKNPYKMSEEELERLKDKNRSLISQFKSKREENNPDDTIPTASAGKKRPLIELSSQNKSPAQKRTSLVNTSLISQAATAHAKKDTESTLNDDLKLFMKDAQIAKLDSFNSENDDGSHIIQPVGQPLPSSRRQQDDFETAQLSSTYRDNIVEPIPNPIIEKPRPISSEQSQSTKLQKKQQKQREIRGIMTKVKGQNARRRRTSQSYKRSHDSAGSRASKFKRKDQFMQTLDVTSDVKDNISKSFDKLNISKSRQNLQSKKRLSIEDPDHEMIKGVQQDTVTSQERAYSDKGLKDTHKHSVYIQANNTLEDEPLDTHQVLQMAPNDINNLSFKQVCEAQQSLYKSLTQLQNHLGSIFLAKQQAPQIAQQQAKVPEMSVFEIPTNQRENLKQHIYTTQYKGGSSVSRENLTTPFSREQQQLRQNYKQQYASERKSEPITSQTAPKMPKIKLIEEDVRERNMVQTEVDNYYKFKRQQRKTKRKKLRQQQETSILDKCSQEELLLMSQVCFLMEKQNLLVEKAKQITTQEFFDDPDNHQKIGVLEEQVELMEVRKASLNKFSVQEMLEKQIMPVAQKLSSRQSLRKLVQTHDSQDLIMAAQDKLISIDRGRSGRRHSQRPQSIEGVRNSSLSNTRLKSMESGQKSKDEARSTYPDVPITLITQPNKEFHLRRSSQDFMHQKSQFSLVQNQLAMANTNSVASTINLFMQKYSSSMAGNPSQVNINSQVQHMIEPILSPDDPKQKSLLASTKQVSPEKPKMMTIQQANTSDFMVGQKSVTNKSTLDQQQSSARILSMEEAVKFQVQIEDRLDNQSVQYKSPTGGEMNLVEFGKQQSNKSLLESPVDKFNLIYKNQQTSSSQYKLQELTQKNSGTLQAYLVKTGTNNSISRSSSKSKSQKSTNKVPFSGLRSRKNSKDLNSDL